MNSKPPTPSHDEERAHLDVDIEAVIAHATAPELAQNSLVHRTRSRIMHAIAQSDMGTHATVHAHENTWQAFLDKIEFKLLNHVDGIASYLLRMQPGAVLPAHRHPIDEECIVLDGELRIGRSLTIKAGGFHLARKEIPHADITTDHGALIFLRGAMPSVEHMV